MIEKDLEIINKLGLHARAAAKLVSVAGQFSSEIRLIKGPMQANGKSIMGVMMLAATKGTLVGVQAEGEDEQEALTALEQIISQRFGEGE